MKKSFALLLSILLLIALPISSSSAAIKAGSKCAKAGATSMSAGKKYTFEGITIEFVKSGNTDLISLGY